MFVPIQLLNQMGITELILAFIGFRVAVSVFRLIF